MAFNHSDGFGQTPYDMIEWSLLKAHHMREQDDEGIGGLKRVPWFTYREHGRKPNEHLGQSPFHWLRAHRAKTRR
jgi:hypothetical protein